MRKHSVILYLIYLFVGFVFAQEGAYNYEAYASYYADAFNGKPTANGEIFDMNAYTAAHKTLPFGTMVEVTNLENGKKVVVRINDRGPFVGNRDIDLSKAAAAALDMLSRGVTRVAIRTIDSADKGAFGMQNTADTAGSASQDQYQQNQAAQQLNNGQNQYNQQGTYQQTQGQMQNGMVYVPTTAAETSGPLWRIQLGSFAREENALRLVSKLRKIGFEPAYEKTETHVRVVLYGIRPYDLEKVKNVLEQNSYRDYILRQESW